MYITLVCGQKSHGRTNGDIEALADARPALENEWTLVRNIFLERLGKREKICTLINYNA